MMPMLLSSSFWSRSNAKGTNGKIEGRLKSSGKQTGCRSEVVNLNGKQQTDFKCNSAAPFAHPYFWSPFVLIGNWR